MTAGRAGTGPPGGGDAGLQRERTRLAWRRTCLAVVVGGVLAVRLLPPLLGRPGLLAAGAVLVAGACLTAAAELRGRRLQRTALDGTEVLPGGGPATALLSATVCLAAVLGAVLVLLDA